MFLKLILGIVLGGTVGGIVGYVGRCSSGTCPLTGHPVSGAILGGAIGFFLAYSTSCMPVQRDTYKSPEVLRISSTSEFDQKVLGEKDRPVLVDFYADWCPPCQEMSPIVEHLADEVKEKSIVAKVNVDEQEELANRYEITGIPTTIVFRNGEAAVRTEGRLNAEDLRKMLAEAK